MYTIFDSGVGRSVNIGGRLSTINSFLGRRELDGIPGIGICIKYDTADPRIIFRSLANLRAVDYANARRVVECCMPAIVRAKAAEKAIEKRVLWSALVLVSFHRLCAERKRPRLPDLGRIQRFMTLDEVESLSRILRALDVSTAEIEGVIRKGRYVSLPEHMAMVVPPQKRGTAPLVMSTDQAHMVEGA